MTSEQNKGTKETVLNNGKNGNEVLLSLFVSAAGSSWINYVL